MHLGISRLSPHLGHHDKPLVVRDAAGNDILSRVNDIELEPTNDLSINVVSTYISKNATQNEKRTHLRQHLIHLHNRHIPPNTHPTPHPKHQALGLHLPSLLLILKPPLRPKNLRITPIHRGIPLTRIRMRRDLRSRRHTRPAPQHLPLFPNNPRKQIRRRRMQPHTLLNARHEIRQMRSRFLELHRRREQTTGFRVREFGDCGGERGGRGEEEAQDGSEGCAGCVGAGLDEEGYVREFLDGGERGVGAGAGV